MTDLKCPKCLAPMRAIERNGVVIDRCTECGGIFLDRGELERLMRAEGTYNEQTYQSDRGSFRRDDDDDDDDDDRRRREGYREGPHQGRPYKKKRKNFLEDLLDFG